VDTVSASCLSYVNATPAPSSNVVTTVRTLTWNTAALGGELNPGQSRTIIITFLAAQGCGTRVNRATLSATNGGGLSVTDTSQVGLDNPQLTIVKTRTSPLTGYVYVGDNVTFSITVTNTGTTTAGRSSPPPAIPLPLADAYSDYNFQFVSATPTESSAGGGQIQWNDIGPVLPGNSVPISVTFKALNGNQGSYVINNASIDFAYDDHNNPIPSVNDSARLIIYSPPLALDDFDTTLVNTVVNGTVMFNDSDDDGEVLTVTPYSGPTTNGNLVLNSNGTYTYTPNPGYTGNDTFIYTLCDPTGKCDTATVTITILPCEDPPVRPQNVH
jgi:hypothetical protein